MGIGNIPNPEAVTPSFFRPGWFIGWRIGWWTGWWNPFEVVLEIDPREVERLTVAQADFLSREADFMKAQADMVKQLAKSVGGVQRGTKKTK